VISVGFGNPYGHPAADTLAELAKHGVQTLRTDRHGSIEVDVDKNSFVVRTGS
jgi:competence protein ComEC